MPARLADGLGLESGPGKASLPLAPTRFLRVWFPRIQPHNEAGFRLRRINVINRGACQCSGESRAGQTHLN